MSRPQGRYCDIGAFEVVQQPQSIEDLIDFFDQGVTDGTLTGAGPGPSAPHRLDAFGNQLNTVAAYIDQKEIDLACLQLDVLLERIDTDGTLTPTEFVTGDDASELAWQIMQLLLYLGCGEG